jgi:2-oxo-4-hydroxy-4-carboxy-5-ureidoimidazoline decarboxylase
VLPVRIARQYPGDAAAALLEAMGVSALSLINDLPAGAAAEELLSCCASPVWARAVVAGRPYPDIAAVTSAAGAALTVLPWSEIALALDAHPRIGSRPTDDRRDAAWSRREQAGVDHGDERTLAALAEVNRAYEERFGRVLLIFASGKSGAELLATAQERLGNDEATEQRVIRAELGKIVALRLQRLLGVHAAVTG